MHPGAIVDFPAFFRLLLKRFCFRGLGLTVTAIILRKFNARVVALSRTQPPELLKLVSEDLLILPCDISDEISLSAALSNAEHKFGYIDSLVLNAGILEPLGFIGGEPSISSWKMHFDVNFFSLVATLKATLPVLRTSEFGGKVIFVSSGAALKGNPSWGPYNASKAAVNSLCRFVKRLWSVA